MKDRRSGLLLLILAGAGIALWASQANASQAPAEEDTGGSWDDPGAALPDPAAIAPGDGVASIWPEWGSLFTSPAPDTTMASDSGDGVAAELAAPDPGIDFGVLSDLGKIVQGWKVAEYPKYASAIRDSEIRWGLPTDYLARTLYQESHFRADIIAGFNRSPAGAIGIAQFEPGTAAQYGLALEPFDYNGQTTQTYEPFKSINAAGNFLHDLHRQFPSWRDVLGAYNWGPGNYSGYLRGKINAHTGKPYALPDETRKYIAQITADVQVA